MKPSPSSKPGKTYAVERHELEKEVLPGASDNIIVGQQERLEYFVNEVLPLIKQASHKASEQGMQAVIGVSVSSKDICTMYAGPEEPEGRDQTLHIASLLLDIQKNGQLYEFVVQHAKNTGRLAELGQLLLKA